jgi:hypothetical protein
MLQSTLVLEKKAAIWAK